MKPKKIPRRCPERDFQFREGASFADLLLADGADGADGHAQGFTAVFLAVCALGGIDDEAGVALIDGRIGALSSTGTAADALVRIDLAGHWIRPSWLGKTEVG